MVRRFPLFLLVFVCSLAARAATVSTFDNGVYVMQADDVITPGGNPLDLAGSTLRATPAGSDRFTLEKVPLTTKKMIGDPVTLKRSGTTGWHYEQVELPFEFPLGDRKFKTAYITAFGAIYFAPPPIGPYDQYGTAAALAAPLPVAAPLLIGNSLRWDSTQIRTRDFGKSFAVTWTFLPRGYPGDVPFGGEVQAVLYDTGGIEFSYISMGRFIGGAVVISTGAEPVREQRATLASVTDAAGDGANVDIRSVEMSRLDALDLIELRIELSAAAPASLDVDVSFSAKNKAGGMLFRRRPEQPVVTLPSWGTALPMLYAQGSSVRILMHEAWLLPPDTFTKFEVTLSEAGVKRDTATLTNVFVPAASAAPAIDVSATSTAVAMPIVEAFTLPDADLDKIQDVLVSQHNLQKELVDAIVVYTSFPTAMDWFSESYTVPGNPGVDGIGTGASSSESRRYPALIFMSSAETIGELMHAFGHRWLFHPRIAPNTYWSINGDYPPQADSTAAFVPGGQSPMGGAPLRDVGAGKYEIACGEHGFTGVELYLMGLADPGEVKPTLEITDGYLQSYACKDYRSGTATAKTTRTITIEQIIAATGRRFPSYANSPKVFPIAYVIIEDPAASIVPDAVSRVRAYAGQHAREFATATGGRGHITIAEPVKKRRSARH